MVNYYHVLGLEKHATKSDIKEAHDRLSKRWEPFKTQDEDDFAVYRFKQIAEAYAVLSDETKRKEYDRKLAENPKVSTIYEGFKYQYQENQSEPMLPPERNESDTSTWQSVRTTSTTVERTYIDYINGRQYKTIIVDKDGEVTTKIYEDGVLKFTDVENRKERGRCSIL